jgi:hypothetical protein
VPKAAPTGPSRLHRQVTKTEVFTRALALKAQELRSSYAYQVLRVSPSFTAGVTQVYTREFYFPRGSKRSRNRLPRVLNARMVRKIAIAGKKITCG